MMAVCARTNTKSLIEMIYCYNCNHQNREQARFCVQCGSPLMLNNRYRVTRVLARGGMGMVYLAHDARQNMRVAIKAQELRGHLPHEQRALEEQTKREFALTVRLAHPALARMMDWFSDARAVYLAMEFVEGESLEAVLQNYGALLSESAVLNYASQLCDALRYLHEQTPPVIHRDIKPGNIYLAPGGQIKLIGFGGAPRANESDKIGISVLTPGFAPLEQYRGKTDPRSDIYSFGATLYNLLTKQLPPDAPGLATRQTMLIPPRQLNPRISPALESIVLKAMALKPEQRFQTANELCAALAVIVPLPLPAYQVSPPRSSSTPDMAAPVIRSEQDNLICPFCGARNATGVIYCDNCGSALAPASPMTSAQQAPPSAPNYAPATTQAMRDPVGAPLSAVPAPSSNTGAVASTLTRYGRTEYVSPMDLGEPYDLRVGILLERHGRSILPNARVNWSNLRIQPQEAEPILRITPYSSGLQISPPLRDLRVKSDADVFADFRIVAQQMPPHGRTDLQIDIEYAGERVKRIPLEIGVQHQFRLGPVRVPHTYWTRCSALGAAILSLDSAFGLYSLVSQIALPVTPVVFGLGLVAAVPLLGLGALLWTRAGKRLIVTA